MCRELTKLHEEIRRGELATLARNYARRCDRAARSFWSSRRRRRPQPIGAAETETLLRQALTRVSLKDAVGEVADATGLPRREVYQRALALAKEADDRQDDENMARRAEPLRPSKSAPRPERLEAFRLGLSAESRAAMFLIAKAYRIVARRWKTPFGEIDIVARRRRALVFVEVKARDSARRRRPKR